MSRGHVLVVTYAFPPSRSVGGVRWGAMSKYLGRLGFDVTVITSRLSGGQSQAEVARVIRPADVESSLSLRRMLRRPDPSLGGDPQGGRPWWTKVVVPDGYLLTWAPFALRAARREIRHHRVDCVVTTSPGESTHLVGLNTRRLGPAWVADFRDGWIFEPARPAFGPRLLDALDRRLESAVVTHADRVVATTEEISGELQSRLGADVVCIPNGWDPDAMATSGGSVGPRTSGQNIRIVYTGELGAGTWRRRPEPFFEALEQFRAQEPELEARLEVVVAGRQTAQDSALLEPFVGRGRVVLLGEVARDRALQLQRSADVLLLCVNSSPAPLKLFEYLAAGPPILHVGGEGAAARILRETRSGTSVLPGDLQGIVDCLREIALGNFGTDLERRELEHYSYPYLAEQMAEVIDDAIKRRSAGRA